MRENIVKGVGVTGKIGIGNAVVIKSSKLAIKHSNISDVEAEVAKYNEAKEYFIEETAKLADDLKTRLNTEDVALIILNHIAIVKDIQFEHEVVSYIRNDKICAQWAVDNVCCGYMDIFSRMDSDVLQQRVADFEDIRDRLVKALDATEKVSGDTKYYDIKQCSEHIILVAKELQPSITATLDTSKLAGIVVENGGETSHVAILAKALGIPTILGAKQACELIREGDVIVVDSQEGLVLIAPDDNQLKEYEDKRYKLIRYEEELAEYKDKETYTSDKARITLLCNIGSVDEAFKINEFNSDGVGLFRTEFLFMDSHKAPTVEEQFVAYRNAVMACKGKMLTIRTLDIGGDKGVSYMGTDKEVNPFLGLRGIRLCLSRKELFKNQIEAILRASAYGIGNVRIMIPLVTSVSEIREVKAIVDDVAHELAAMNVEYDSHIKIGIMVETPSAVLMAREFAREVDFFSIGTNDLTQYIMAVDRGNEAVAYLFDTMQPAVLKAIKYVVNVANEAGIEVSMCGEAAGDRAMLPILLGLGLRKFSVASSLILETRQNISSWSIEDAERVTAKVMKMISVEEIVEYGADL